MTPGRRHAEFWVQVADQERIRLGADLHDGLCQELTGLSYMLSGLAKRARREGSALAADIDALSQIASATIASAHDIAHGMLPMALRQGDLRGVLKAFARSTQRAHQVPLSIRFRGSFDLYPVGRIGEHFYRIAQESVSNAIRHGHATHIALSLMAKPRRLIFSILDDGKGFTGKRSSRGMGLQIMRYRMRLLGGWLEVKHPRAGGTQILCVVPREAGPAIRIPPPPGPERTEWPGGGAPTDARSR